jgi:hypothetical protein
MQTGIQIYGQRAEMANDICVLSLHILHLRQNKYHVYLTRLKLTYHSEKYNGQKELFIHWV